MSINHPDVIPHEKFLKSILLLTSRTFALNIPLLRGNLYWSVLISYLLCRIIDTVEDSTNVKINLKKKLLTDFISFLKENNVHEWTKWKDNFLSAKPEGEANHLKLVSNTEKVLEAYWSLPVNYRLATKEPIINMAKGMSEFLDTFDQAFKSSEIYPLKKLSDLELYCYFVAGTVGELLTACFSIYIPKLKENKKNLLDKSVNFGLSLQLVNIAKDYSQDAKRGVCFIPKEIINRHNNVRLSILKEIVPIIIKNSRVSLEYIHEISFNYIRVKLFCLWPLWLALVTTQKISEVLINTEKEINNSIKISKFKLFQTLIWVTLISWSKSLLDWDFKRRTSRFNNYN